MLIITLNFGNIIISISDVDSDPVGSGFMWVRGSGSGSRGMKSLIKLRESRA